MHVFFILYTVPVLAASQVPPGKMKVEMLVLLYQVPEVRFITAIGEFYY